MATIRRHQIESTQTGKTRLVPAGPGRDGFLGMTHKNAKGKQVPSWKDTGKAEVVDDEGKAEIVTVKTGPPAKSDTKDEWVAYAESIGVDPGDLNKDDLIKAVEDAES